MNTDEVSFQVLGPLTATRDGVALPLGGVKPRTVLAMLLLHRGQVVPAARLIDAVWAEDPPASARVTLQTYVSHLRRSLGPETIRTAAPGYAATAAAEALDAARFERLATRGRDALAAGNLAGAAAHLRVALAQWQGAPLADLSDLPFAGGHVARLQRARDAALVDRIDVDLAAGQHAAVAAELEGLVAAEPLAEPLWIRLMQALYGAGRQTEALAAYRRAREALAEHAGVEPAPALRAAEAAVLAHDPAFAPGPTSAARSSVDAGGLPAPVDSFVGRDHDLAGVTDLLGRHRLVTITGPGGCGKTRLALEAARDGTQDAARTWLVELGGLDAETLVARTVADTVQPPASPAPGGPPPAVRDPLDVAAGVLAAAPALLVVDNCEHVLDGAAACIAALLARCPQLRILATSREPLASAGEAVHLLRPLTVAAAQVLFVERADAARPGVAARLRGVDAPLVSEVCRRLDGLPLAVELAAARIRLLDVGEILVRLEDRFALLDGGRRDAPDRHRTLRAAVAWSEAQLQPVERRTFARLAVFPDTFSLPAAEAVAAGPLLATTEVLGVLGRLVDTSLLQRVGSAHDGTRFRLLETLRLYAAERLDHLGEVDDARGAHAAFTVAHAAELGAGSRGPDQAVVQRRYQTGVHDHRQALAHLVERGDLAGAWQLARGLWYLWARFGHVEEARRWFTDTAALADRHPRADLCTRASLRSGAAFFSWAARHPDAAHHANAGLALAEQVGDPDAVGTCLVVLALDALARDDTAAYAWLRRALTAHADAGDPGGVAMCHAFLSLAARRRGMPDVALRESESALALYRELGDVWGIGWALWSTGRASAALGDWDEAAARYRAAVRVTAESSHHSGLVLCLRGLAEVAWATGDRTHAALLLGSAEALAADLRTELEALGRAEDDVDLQALRSALHDPALAAATAEGAALGIQEVITQALADDLPL